MYANMKATITYPWGVEEVYLHSLELRQAEDGRIEAVLGLDDPHDEGGHAVPVGEKKLGPGGAWHHVEVGADW